MSEEPTPAQKHSGDHDWSRYEMLVGKRAAYYLPRFQRFERGGWLSWNWAAFFGTLAWLRYRGLKAWSWAYFFVSTPLLCVYLLWPRDACEAALDTAFKLAPYLILALVALGWIVPPLVANRLYYAHVRRLVERADAGPQHAGRGSVAAAIALQALVALIFVVAFPAYAIYTYRARVSEAVLAAGGARTPVHDYLKEHGRLPARLEDAGGAAGATRYVEKLELVDKGTIRATFSEHAGRLAGHSILMLPQWKGDEIVGWSCASRDLPNVCLPHFCREVR